MDPATVIGVASGILTFIQLSWDIIHGTYEIRSSVAGATAKDTHISHILNDLSSVTKGLTNNMYDDGPNGLALQQLASQCQVVSIRLAALLQRLHAKDQSTWECLKVKLKSMHKDAEVMSLEHILASYRQEIIMRIELMVLNNQSSVKAKLDTMQNEGLRFSVHSAEQLKDIRLQMRGIYRRLSSTEAENKALQTKIAEAPFAVLERAPNERKSLIQELQESIMALQSHVGILPNANSVLRRLYFPTMCSREDYINIAEEGTFEWLLQWHPRISDEDQDPIEISFTADGTENDCTNENMSLSKAQNGYETPEDETCCNGAESTNNESGALAANKASLLVASRKRIVSERLCSFLHHENGIYFIVGKAGSGKSTLMKLLSDHRNVQQALSSWVGDKHLIILSFFFWASGDPLQMSLEGLQRAVLYEAIRQYPDLVDVLFSSTAGEVRWGAEDGPFRIAELKTAIEKLMRMEALQNHRICLFLDGLDEFHGTSTVHVQLARDLRAWSQSPEVKVICSARPHAEFMKVFSGAGPIIHLHELTLTDIMLFLERRVSVELAVQGRMLEWEYFRDIINGMAVMAEGVFLWARLVLESVLESILHEESPELLRQRIKAHPMELDGLFERLLSDIHPTVREESDRMFRLALNNPFDEQLPAVMYSWVNDVEHCGFPFSTALSPYDSEEIEQQIRRVTLRLRTLTKGLLEVRKIEDETQYGQFRVEFLHKSAKDYLERHRKSHIQKHAQTRWSFHDQNVWLNYYVRLGLAYLKCQPTHQPDHSFPIPTGRAFCRAHGQGPGFRSCCYSFKGTIDDRLLAEVERLITLRNRVLGTSSKEKKFSAVFGYRNNSTANQELGIQLGEHHRSYSTVLASGEVRPISVLGMFVLSEQHQWVIRKLKSKDYEPLFPTELSHILLISSHGRSANTALVSSLFEHGVRPGDPINVDVLKKPDPLITEATHAGGHDQMDGPENMSREATEYGRHELPTWIVVLWIFAIDVQQYSSVTHTAHLLTTDDYYHKILPEILELYLSHGAARDVIIICRKVSDSVQTMCDHGFDLQEKFQSPVVDSRFYLNVSQLVSILRPPNDQRLQALLGGGVLSRLIAFARGSAPQTVRQRFRHVTLEELTNMAWEVIGIATDKYDFTNTELKLSVVSDISRG